MPRISLHLSGTRANDNTSPDTKTIHNPHEIKIACARNKICWKILIKISQILIVFVDKCKMGCYTPV